MQTHLYCYSMPDFKNIELHLNKYIICDFYYENLFEPLVILKKLKRFKYGWDLSK